MTSVTDIKVGAPREPGSYVFDVYIKSSDYIGLDLKETVTMVVKPENEAPKFVVHPDDIALDKEPTLFQQIYGNKGEESDSSDDEADGEGKEHHGHSHSNGGGHGHSHGGT